MKTHYLSKLQCGWPISRILSWATIHLRIMLP